MTRLAESLDLSLRDRNELLLSPGFAATFPESDLDSEALRPARDALVSIIEGHEPYPAVIVKLDGEVVAANRTLEIFTEGVAPELLAEPMNGFRLALQPQGMAPRIRNFAIGRNMFSKRCAQGCDTAPATRPNSSSTNSRAMCRRQHQDQITSASPCR